MKKESLINKAFIFRGLVATSKSTTAKFLKEMLEKNSIQTYLLRTDDVRKQEIPKNELTYSDEERMAIYKEMARRGRNLMTHGIVVIYDATCETEDYLWILREKIPEEIIPILIETTCPEEVSLKRIKIRDSEKMDLSDAGVEQYHLIKGKFKKFPPNILIDTSGTREDIKFQLEISLNSL